MIRDWHDFVRPLASRRIFLMKLRPGVAVAAGVHGCARQLARARLRRSAPERDLSQLAVVTVRHSNGIAKGATLQHEALSRFGHPVQLLYGSTSPRDFLRPVPHHRASAYVFHTTPPESSMLVHSVLPEAASAWRIGYWAWELPDLPPRWRRFEGLVSEVWAPSNFVADSLRRVLTVPVTVVPHQVPPQEARQRDFDKPLRVLVMADSRSSFTRKNPMGAVTAFRRAFGNSRSFQLVVKLNGRSDHMSALARAVAGMDNVQVITGYLPEAEMSTLYRSVDVLISLHRAEGFGLPMLEAMSHGIPVIATAWSGNTDFMSDDNSLLVPFNLVKVDDELRLYRNSHWAEPDVEVAASHLRLLATDQAAYCALAEAAHKSVLDSDPLASLR